MDVTLDIGDSGTERKKERMKRAGRGSRLNQYTSYLMSTVLQKTMQEGLLNVGFYFYPSL